MMEGIANRISPLPSSVSAARKLWFRGALSLAVTLGLRAVSPVSQAQTLTILYSFASYTDGYPPSAVIRDAAGNLYGTTFHGGTPGNGTVFKLDASGNKTVLHAFTTTHSDGRSPSAGLVLSGQDFYGTTTAGGTSASGTVFKLDKNSKESVLYSFTGGADGGNPFAGLIRDASGNLYGTTFNGGIGSYGTVFKLDATGKETVLYKFTGGEDGQNPGLGVVQDAAGNLYGMTGIGGDLSCTYDVGGGCGTVFKLDRNGNKTVLHSFSGKADGAYGSAMTLDAAGNLYGATQLGGDPTCGCGTVFKLDKTGKKTVLHIFAGADGSYPFAGVMLDKAGNLYGTTNTGGAFGFGTVFKITP